MKRYIVIFSLLFLFSDQACAMGRAMEILQEATDSDANSGDQAEEPEPFLELQELVIADPCPIAHAELCRGNPFRSGLKRKRRGEDQDSLEPQDNNRSSKIVKEIHKREMSPLFEAAFLNGDIPNYPGCRQMFSRPARVQELREAIDKAKELEVAIRARAAERQQLISEMKALLQEIRLLVQGSKHLLSLLRDYGIEEEIEAQAERVEGWRTERKELEKNIERGAIYLQDYLSEKKAEVEMARAQTNQDIDSIQDILKRCEAQGLSSDVRRRLLS